MLRRGKRLIMLGLRLRRALHARSVVDLNERRGHEINAAIRFIEEQIKTEDTKRILHMSDAALYRLMLVSSVLNIWGVLVFLSILRLSRKLLLLLSAVLLRPRVIFLLLVLCFLSLVSHNHSLSMALS